jgi:hypothetical protein
MTREIRVDRDGQRVGAGRDVATIAAFETLESVLDVEVQVGLVLLHGALDLTPSGLESLGRILRRRAVAGVRDAPRNAPLSFATPAVTAPSGAIVSSGLVADWIDGSPAVAAPLVLVLLLARNSGSAGGAPAVVAPISGMDTKRRADAFGTAPGCRSGLALVGRPCRLGGVDRGCPAPEQVQRFLGA